MNLTVIFDISAQNFWGMREIALAVVIFFLLFVIFILLIDTFVNKSVSKARLIFLLVVMIPAGWFSYKIIRGYITHKNLQSILREGKAEKIEGKVDYYYVPKWFAFKPDRFMMGERTFERPFTLFSKSRYFPNEMKEGSFVRVYYSGDNILRVEEASEIGIENSTNDNTTTPSDTVGTSPDIPADETTPDGIQTNDKPKPKIENKTTKRTKHKEIHDAPESISR